VNEQVSFHDFEPVTESLKTAVVRGLQGETKSIPPKFFYDRRGSELFDQICDQPEYYVPEVERSILGEFAGEISEAAGIGSLLVEPGAGNSAKVRLLLDALRPSAYVPMDISGRYLQHSAQALAAEYPWLRISAACTDFSGDLRLPPDLPSGARSVFFPGSSLGNFDRAQALDFLRRVRALIEPDGFLLIGVDTKKDTAVLDAAYNDAQGVTAAFNLNLLARINRELGADFDLDGFAHEAFYNEVDGRIEMHLRSLRRQSVAVDGHRFAFDAGERLHTESSYKYSPPEFLELAATSGLRAANYWTDEREFFAVYLLLPVTDSA